MGMSEVCARAGACVRLRSPALTTPPTPGPPLRAQPHELGLCLLGDRDPRLLPLHSLPSAQRPRATWPTEIVVPPPLRGPDQAAPSPTAAEPRAPSPPPGPGKGLRKRCGLRSGGGGGQGECERPTPDPSPPRSSGPAAGQPPLQPTQRPPGANPRRRSPPPAQPCRDSQLLPVPAGNRSLPPPPAPSPDGHRCPHPPGTALRSRPVAAAGSLPTPHPSPQPPSLAPAPLLLRRRRRRRRLLLPGCSGFLWLGRRRGPRRGHHHVARGGRPPPCGPAWLRARRPPAPRRAARAPRPLPDASPRSVAWRVCGGVCGQRRNSGDTAFHELQVCGNPALIKCIGTNFPTALFLNEGW
ncbi:proline-rich protein HaeIII subfamily 1-like [Ovis canadensis]|uniref:proline-rich protein HaeIII subfamily 1-like n=1 Tax=Ovis canadensis TaxID=37174 RepID=UPI003753C6AB